MDMRTSRHHNEVVEAPAVVACPDVVRAAIAELEHDGCLTPESVVDAAADPESPLHSFFTWDDGEAAKSWRVEQARRLIRSVKVVVTYETDRVAVPYYVRDTSRNANETGYVTTDKAKSDPESAAAILRYEFGRAAAHARRAVAISEAVGMQAEARRVVASIEKLLRKLGDA